MDTPPPTSISYCYDIVRFSMSTRAQANIVKESRGSNHYECVRRATQRRVLTHESFQLA